MLHVEQALVVVALARDALLLLATRDATIAVGLDAESELFVPVLLLGGENKNGRGQPWQTRLILARVYLAALEVTGVSQ